MVKAVVCGAAGEHPSFLPQHGVPSIHRHVHFARPEHITDLHHLIGGIGQPLSLLLKLNPLITELSLYDVVNAPGVSAPSFSLSALKKASLLGDANPANLLYVRWPPICRTSLLLPKSPVSSLPTMELRRPSRVLISLSFLLVFPGSPV